jgi:Putative prokaryotic signal transducing protein
MSLVPVLTCASVEEAATYRGVLEAHGVQCVVQGEHHRALLGMLGPYVEVRLLVPADQEGTARRLLRPEPSLVVDEELGPDADRARSRRLLGWIALAVLGGPSIVAAVLGLLARCG